MGDSMNFETIYQTVCKAISDAQYARLDEVKAVVNMVYLNEVCQCDELYPLFWLVECDDSKKTKTRATITAITAASPPSVTAATHGFASGDLVTLYSIVGMTELNYRTFRITRTNANVFTLQDLSGSNIDGSAYTAYTSGGYAHHRGITITSCAKVIRANWHGYNKGLDFIDSKELEDQSTWWDVSTSRPLKMMNRRVYTAAGTQYDYLLWFQSPDAVYYMRLWYEKQVARLSATTDIPILPYQFHDAIVAGAITRLGENKVQIEAGVIWPGIYKAQIEAIKAFNRKFWKENQPYERQGLFLA